MAYVPKIDDPNMETYDPKVEVLVNRLILSGAISEHFISTRYRKRSIWKQFKDWFMDRPF